MSERAQPLTCQQRENPFWLRSGYCCLFCSWHDRARDLGTLALARSKSPSGFLSPPSRGNVQMADNAHYRNSISSELQSIDRDIIGSEVDRPFVLRTFPAVRRSDGWIGAGLSPQTHHNPQDEFWHALAGSPPTGVRSLSGSETGLGNRRDSGATTFIGSVRTRAITLMYMYTCDARPTLACISRRFSEIRCTIRFSKSRFFSK